MFRLMCVSLAYISEFIIYAYSFSSRQNLISNKKKRGAYTHSKER
jgi:hypothetical protein